jgi:CheY-like chemotaxis protein
MNPAPYRLLVIEDSDEDFEALSRIIAQVSTISLDVHRCIDGDDALDFLNQQGKYHQNNFDLAIHKQPHRNPDLIILDLNLPGTDGREILVLVKQTKALKVIPIVVLSTSSNPKDIEICYQSGANSYMLKPMNINTLKDSFRVMLDYWFRAMILPNSGRS